MGQEFSTKNIRGSPGFENYPEYFNGYKLPNEINNDEIEGAQKCVLDYQYNNPTIYHNGKFMSTKNYFYILLGYWQNNKINDTSRYDKYITYFELVINDLKEQGILNNCILKIIEQKVYFDGHYILLKIFYHFESPVYIDYWIMLETDKNRKLRYTILIKEELIAAAWRPDRVQKWLDNGCQIEDC